MSAKQDKLISEQQTYLDMVTASEPYRTISVYDRINACAELTALRADVQYWQQTADQERTNAAEQRERAEKLRSTIEAQARKLEDAESVLIAIRPHLPIFCDEYNSIHPSRKLIDDWFSANPPAPQAQPAQRMIETEVKKESNGD